MIISPQAVMKKDHRMAGFRAIKLDMEVVIVDLHLAC